jgi:heat shock protein HslJ
VTVRDGLLLTLALLLPLTLAACGSNAETPAAATARARSPLEDTTWLLETYGDAKNPKNVLAGGQITATFGATKGYVTGSAGCNGYGGGYQAAGGKLSVADLIATKKFCSEPPDVMDQEQQYLTILQAAQRYQVTGRTLEVFAADGKLLRFTARE